MNIFRIIIKKPIYKILFGSEGVLTTILAALPLFKRAIKRDNGKNKSTDQQSEPVIKPANSSETLEQEEVNSKQRAVSFTSELIYNSPAGDEIVLSKIDVKKNHKNSIES